MKLEDFLHRNALLQPTKAAVLTSECSITYAELDDSVTCLARHLLHIGLRPGDRVAVHRSNSIETVQLLLALFRAGLIAVPINLRLKSPEIAYIFEHCQARVCFSEPALAPLAEQASRDGGPEILTHIPALTPLTTDLPEIDPDQPALIIYTSGTTARPKGVVHTHRSMFEATRIMSPDPYRRNDIVLAATQLMHVSALNVVLLPVLYVGASAVLLQTFDPGAALDLVERFRCTFLLALPTQLQFVAEEQVRHARDISSLVNILGGGDAVPVALQQHFQDLCGVDVREAYGLTEGMLVTFNRSIGNRTGSIGPEAPEVFIRLVDPRGREVGEGETGEILVYSPAICAGYWNDPDATARLLEGGWLHTGDLGYRDADGYYWFKGRVKQLIIRGGSNISPQEVEEALYQHPAVLEAGVIGAPNRLYGEVPVAFVSLRPGFTLSEDRLVAHSRRLLADYKAPERILFMEELPKGLTGKVDRRFLREMFVAQAEVLEGHSLAVA